MAQIEKIRALILRRTKYAEADLVLQFLTPRGGKISGLARGALKSKKRFGGGVLEPTHFVEIILRPSNRSDGLGTIEEAKLIEGFDGLRSSYDRLDAALRLTEIVSKVAQEADAGSSHLFDLLGHALRALQTAPSVANLSAQFCLKLLYHQGVLEVENWMESYLKAPVSSGDELLQPSVGQLQWIDEQVDVYLKTAERL